MEKLKMKAGTYFVGDNCYAIENDKWDSFCNELFKGDPVFEFEGVTVVSFNTAYGDGCYFDQNDNLFCVDAGIIGLTPIEICGKYESKKLEKLGKIVEFKEDFYAWSDMSDEGKICLGHIEIKTDEEEDEEEEDCCEICADLLDDPWGSYDGICDDCRESEEDEEDMPPYTHMTGDYHD